MAASSNPIIIVGAGIAGITAALFLRKYSIPVKVIESRLEVTTEGAGIQLTPNALRVLADLNLSDELISHGHCVSHLSIHSATSGAQIVEVPYGDDFRQVHNAPYIVIHRGDLVKSLHDLAIKQDIEIALDTPFDTDCYNLDDVIIGADGIWSATRARVNESTAQFTGRIAFRSLLKAEDIEKKTIKDLTMWLGPDIHFVAYPVNSAGDINLVCVIKGAKIDQKWSTSVDQDHVLQHLSSWNALPINLVRQSHNWTKWPLFGVKPEDQWTKGNMALIGDAAHAMVPFLAQGGAMAIEDAAVIAHALASEGPAKQAFASYQSARKDRVSRIWYEALGNADRYHWKGFKAKARDIALKSMGGHRLKQRYDWIYKWQPPALVRQVDQSL